MNKIYEDKHVYGKSLKICHSVKLSCRMIELSGKRSPVTAGLGSKDATDHLSWGQFSFSVFGESGAHLNLLIFPSPSL